VADFTELVAKFSTFKKRRGRQLFNALRSGTNEDHPELFDKLMAAYTIGDTDHPFMKFAKKYDKLAHASSLKACLVMRTRRRLLSGDKSCPEWLLQHKKFGYQFADIAGLRRPATSGAPVHYSKVDIKPGTALKPPSGSQSNGVYLVISANRILDVAREEIIDDIGTVRKLLEQDYALKRVPHPTWTAEELILDATTPSGIANDVKFYCFYGQVHRIGIIQRFPEHFENWFDAKGVHSAGPKSGIATSATVSYADIPKALITRAKEISLQIPAPFVRIDFLSSPDGEILGEFTARPGTVHLLNRETDRDLGDQFLKASVRLENDLLAGKDFSAYRTFFANRKPLAQRPV
jgi:hypothetical protein